MTAHGACDRRPRYTGAAGCGLCAARAAREHASAFRPLFPIRKFGFRSTTATHSSGKASLARSARRRVRHGGGKEPRQGLRPTCDAWDPSTTAPNRGAWLSGWDTRPCGPLLECRTHNTHTGGQRAFREPLHWWRTCIGPNRCARQAPPEIPALAGAARVGGTTGCRRQRAKRAPRTRAPRGGGPPLGAGRAICRDARVRHQACLRRKRAQAPTQGAKGGARRRTAGGALLLIALLQMPSQDCVDGDATGGSRMARARAM
jgi:hypothetical protein